MLSPPVLCLSKGAWETYLQQDLLQTRCYRGAVEREMCEEGPGGPRRPHHLEVLVRKSCHLLDAGRWPVRSAVHVFHLPHYLRNGERETAVLLGFIVKRDTQESGMTWPFLARAFTLARLPATKLLPLYQN